ncbi:MAG: hypothetical protein JXA99_02545 [Candidatus Lokiarchaeota archaeon]|nr:hypothetical protein [Candidatus Lokiarchaeota archaeon]
MSKPIGIRIDKRQEKIWEDFKNFVETKYGKKHTVLGQELIEALQLYIWADKQSDKENTHLLTKKSGKIEIEPIKENSYEIINPLFVARGYLDIFKNSEALDDTQKKEIAKIDKNLAKIDTIIESRIKRFRK